MLLTASLSRDSLADETAPRPYQRDVFVEREVEACEISQVRAAFPVKGGHDWIFDGAIVGSTVIACNALPKMVKTPVPRSVLRGTDMETWKVSASGLPETVELLNGVPHRVVVVNAIGPSAMRKTEGPCHEPLVSVVCEDSDDFGEAITALREAEAAIRSAEYLRAKGNLAAANSAIDSTGGLIKTASEGRKGMESDVTVKTSDGGLESRAAFGKRIVADLQRIVDLMKAMNAAKSKQGAKH